MNAHAAAADPMAPVPFEIARSRHETEDVFMLWLKPPHGLARALYEPGQFNMLYVFGVGEAAISISAHPTESELVMHTIRSVGTVTARLAELKVGMQVGVRGPFGTSWPLRDARNKDVVLIAGGIGLAPLRPALLEIAAHRERFGKVTLVYGARTPEGLLFTRELERLQKTRAITVLTTVDHADRRWKGNVGVAPALVEKAELDPSNAIALLCGPEVMMRFSVQALEARGVPDGRIFLSLERNMKCAVGLCGHCQYVGHFLCKDGPVYSYDTIRRFFVVKEL